MYDGISLQIITIFPTDKILYLRVLLLCSFENSRELKQSWEYRYRDMVDTLSFAFPVNVFNVRGTINCSKLKPLEYHNLSFGIINWRN